MAHSTTITDAGTGNAMTSRESDACLFWISSSSTSSSSIEG